MATAESAATSGADTKTRYLDAAEDLFVQLGYEGASVRAISHRAEANLGTLTYYFGTKEALFRAVCERRFVPIIAEQTALLSACKARLDAGESVALEEVIRALVAPAVFAHADAPELQHKVRMLYGRTFTEPSEVVLRVNEEIVREAADLVVGCVRRLLPELDDRVFYTRYTSAIGALFFPLACSERMHYVHKSMPKEIDWTIATDEIVAFMVHGLQGAPR